MTDERWYMTTGREHIRRFSLMIEAAIRLGEERGIRRKPNVAVLMELYRGRGSGRYKGS